MSISFFFFFFNDTATTEIYTLSLHDALPIWTRVEPGRPRTPPGSSAASSSVTPSAEPAGTTPTTGDPHRREGRTGPPSVPTAGRPRPAATSSATAATGARWRRRWPGRRAGLPRRPAGRRDSRRRRPWRGGSPAPRSVAGGPSGRGPGGRAPRPPPHSDAGSRPRPAVPQD